MLKPPMLLLWPQTCRGLRLDTISCNAAMNACAGSGHWAAGLALLARMSLGIETYFHWLETGENLRGYLLDCCLAMSCAILPGRLHGSGKVSSARCSGSSIVNGSPAKLL